MSAQNDVSCYYGCTRFNSFSALSRCIVKTSGYILHGLLLFIGNIGFINLFNEEYICNFYFNFN